MTAANKFLASLTLDLPERLKAASRVQRLYLNSLLAEEDFDPVQHSVEWLEAKIHNWNDDQHPRRHFVRVVGLVTQLGQHRIRTGLDLVVVDDKDVVLMVSVDEWACGVSLPGVAKFEYFQLNSVNPPRAYDQDVLVQQLVARAFTESAGEEFALPLQLPRGFLPYQADPEVRLVRVPMTHPLNR